MHERNVIKMCGNYWDNDNVIFIATITLKVKLAKKWGVNNCKAKIRKNFTQSEIIR